jgi:hypothetical protein
MINGLLFDMRAVQATFDDVNWTINTPFKRAFFTRVAEITGYPGDTQSTARRFD